MIRLDGVTKRYGPATVLDGVSLRIPRGGVTCLVGANGAGKSTLLGVVGRLLDPDGGRVTVDGLDVAACDSRELARRLAVLRQENHVPVRLTVRELVEFGRYPHSAGRLSSDDHAHVDRALAWLELRDLDRRRLDQLSGGQRQRAFIAMVLSQDTDYVLLDEPLNDLDMRHASQTMQLISSMADELGRTVLVVVHDVNVAAAYGDRLVALRDGVVVADGPPADVVRRDVLHDVFGVDVPVHDVDGHRVSMFFAPPPSHTALDRGDEIDVR